MSNALILAPSHLVVMQSKQPFHSVMCQRGRRERERVVRVTVACYEVTVNAGTHEVVSISCVQVDRLGVGSAFLFLSLLPSLSGCPLQ